MRNVIRDVKAEFGPLSESKFDERRGSTGGCRLHRWWEQSIDFTIYGWRLRF